MTKYDAIIIGSGQAGTPLAKKLAKAGLKTALIEKRWIGGTCVNDGCTPTKALVASARTAYTASRSHELGIDIDTYSINFRDVMRRQAAIVRSFRDGSLEGLQQLENLHLIFGEAKFIAAYTLEVSLNDGRTVEMSSEKIFIDIGTRPRIPEIKGIEDVRYLTSTSILNLEAAPEHLLIIGGGYIGLEYGQMFRRFGCEVTIVDSSEAFLPKEDGDIALAILNIFEEEGIKIYTNSEIKEFEQRPDGTIAVLFNQKDHQNDLLCTHVLIATGRVPQTDILNPAASGIDVNDRGYITVNSKLETNMPGIYALGEVNGSAAFTHIAYNDYVIVYKNLLENTDLTMEGRPVPYCMYTDPQLGRIGITEAEARKNGHSIRVAKLGMEKVARAIETSETRGLIKVVVDVESKEILGASVLSAEGGEIMTVLQMAMEGGLTYDKLREMVFAHPTFSESLNTLFAGL